MNLVNLFHYEERIIGVMSTQIENAPLSEETVKILQKEGYKSFKDLGERFSELTDYEDMVEERSYENLRSFARIFKDLL